MCNVINIILKPILNNKAELLVDIVCNGVSKVPEVYEYINLQSWTLYKSINLTMPNCLNSGAVGALYTVLQMLRIAFIYNISTLCNLYLNADPHSIVP